MTEATQLLYVVTGRVRVMRLAATISKLIICENEITHCTVYKKYHFIQRIVDVAVLGGPRALRAELLQRGGGRRRTVAVAVGGESVAVVVAGDGGGAVEAVGGVGGGVEVAAVAVAVALNSARRAHRKRIVARQTNSGVAGNTPPARGGEGVVVRAGQTPPDSIKKCTRVTFSNLIQESIFHPDKTRIFHIKCFESPGVQHLHQVLVDVRKLSVDVRRGSALTGKTATKKS